MVEPGCTRHVEADERQAATHLVDLEELAEIQAEKLAEMSLVMAKLRKENDALKANNLGPLA